MTTQSLAVESFARADRSAATTHRGWPLLFTACLWMAGILFLYVREAAPPESGMLLMFGAGLMTLGSALAARARSAR